MKISSTSFTPPISRQAVLVYDVADAVTDEFICTIRIPYVPLFRPSMVEVMAFIYSKRPTLKYREIMIEPK